VVQKSGERNLHSSKAEKYTTEIHDIKLGIVQGTFLADTHLLGLLHRKPDNNQLRDVYTITIVPPLPGFVDLL
jgi:hypothetical protein